MHDTSLSYLDGVEICVGDRVLVCNQKATIVKVFHHGDSEGPNWSLPDGGFLVKFDNGDFQAWTRADEDIEREKGDRPQIRPPH